jgi:hypothetical protein
MRLGRENWGLLVLTVLFTATGAAMVAIITHAARRAKRQVGGSGRDRSAGGGRCGRGPVREGRLAWAFRGRGRV